MTTITSASTLPGQNTSSSAKLTSANTALPQNFLALLSQILADGTTLNENPLLQLLPGQLASGGVLQNNQLAAALASADTDKLTETHLAQLLMLPLTAAGQSVTASNNANTFTRQANNSSNSEDAAQSADMAALNLLLAMLPQAPQTSHIARVSSEIAKHNVTTPADSASASLPGFSSQQQPASGLADSLAELTSTSVIQPVPFTDDKLKNNSDRKASTDHSAPLSTTKGINPKSTGAQPELVNNVLPAASSTQNSDAETASRNAALLATHNTLTSQAAATPLSTTNSAEPGLSQHSLLIHAPLGSARWQQTLGQSISLFTRQGRHSAELRLHPAELGSVKISLKLDDNQAQLQMISPHSHVRAALEMALPVLRAQLAESGIQLSQTSISSESFAGQQQGQHQQQPSPPSFTSQRADVSENTLETPASLVAMAQGDNAVDTFV